MTANLRVVDAHYPADFERLRAVREPVFVIEQHCPIEEEWDALDAPSAHALVLNERDEPVATGRLTPDHKIGRMAVLADYRGSGVGALIMEHLIAKARALGYPELALSSQVHAIPFYERFGFIADGPEYPDANIPHRMMYRPLPATSPTGLIQFDRAAAARVTAMDLMRAARHRIGIASHSLDAELFDHDAVIALIKRVAMSGRGARIQILVEDITTAVQNSHRLVGLAQRLSSLVEVRRANRRADPEFGPAVVLSDHGGWLRRPDPTRFEGEACLDDRPRAREMWLSFDRSWERAEPESAVRALKL
ncbi:MAG: GNAT family N-acetyltransferase [Rhodanobacteraceae bacterium]|mgnify:CR=1 FL=1|nr:GNAT family N-acetyltransferase [Rhodanobacteraceae bacterium]MBL0041978.1 GNAT family N-acetyltransferase [Xanthomonadales bacterium]